MSRTEWSGFFGGIPASPTNVFTLLWAGVLVPPDYSAPTSDDIGKLVTSWLKAHPKGELIPVFNCGRFLKGKLIWAWLVDGTDNLNLELVRQGACPADTMRGADTQHLLIPPDEYERFESQLAGLEQLAKRDKLGIWK